MMVYRETESAQKAGTRKNNFSVVQKNKRYFESPNFPLASSKEYDPVLGQVSKDLDLGLLINGLSTQGHLCVEQPRDPQSLVTNVYYCCVAPV